MHAGTGNGQAGLGYGHKIFMEVRVCFYQKTNPTFIVTKQKDYNRPLQILAFLY